jgi:hypothetical protein
LTAWLHTGGLTPLVSQPEGVSGINVGPACGGGGPVPPPPTRTVSAKVSYNAKKKLAVLNPADALKANTLYTPVVEGAGDPDSFAVKDRTGNEMACEYAWTFTTGGS